MYTTADAVYEHEERKNWRRGCYRIPGEALMLHFARQARVEQPRRAAPENGATEPEEER